VTDLIKEELNIKDVLFRQDIGAYMNYSLKPDFKAAGPVLGSRMKDFAAALQKTDAAALIRALDGEGPVSLSLETGELVGMPLQKTDAEASVRASDGGEKVSLSLETGELSAEQADRGDCVVVTTDIVDIRVEAKEGFAVAMESGLFVILDTTVTPELAREGLAREFISKVQQIRKQIGLEMMDNVRIHFHGDDEVAAAIDAHQSYIMKETLAALLKDMATGDGETYDLNGHKTEIVVEKV
jgi:isoleucyl-tRNA synthetase